ncbi:hypothetical protein [Microcoleus sp. OTE_8_concoct_300]|uniref:hypothetical protein n=1 Tax=Microcoleus sp. OTE_8_concoct_300 TaxID=2964710 RepID=UPI00403F91AC
MPVPSIDEKDFCQRSIEYRDGQDARPTIIVEKLTVKLDAQQLTLFTRGGKFCWLGSLLRSHLTDY